MQIFYEVMILCLGQLAFALYHFRDYLTCNKVAPPNVYLKISKNNFKSEECAITKPIVKCDILKCWYKMHGGRS